MDLFNVKAKTKESVATLIATKNFEEILKYEKQIMKDSEPVLSGIDEAVLLLLREEKYHKQISDFFIYLANCGNDAMFKLYYELLLFNYDLYETLSKQQNFETVLLFDHHLLFQANDYHEGEAKIHALSVLSMLKDSFLMKESLKNGLDVLKEKK